MSMNTFLFWIYGTFQKITVMNIVTENDYDNIHII